MVADLERRIARLRQGDHLCLIYDHAAERLAALIPFLQCGLAAGERCLYLADGATTDRVERVLQAEGIDVGRERERGGLVLLTRRDAYLKDGRFDPGAMMDLLRQAEQEALDDNFSGLRMAGEMNGCLGREPGTERSLEYEAMLNHFLAGSRSIALCQYERSRFTPQRIHEILRTHPVAVLGDEICPNIFYEPPEMVLGPTSWDERVGWMIAQLRQARANERKYENLTRRLAQQRGALERADRAKEELLGMLAHELRNPLGTISNAIQVLRIKGNGDETCSRAVDAAERQVHRQALLVDDLLEASKVARGEIELRCEPLDLAVLVRGVAEGYRATLREAGLDLVLEVTGKPLPVWGDSGRLTQALSNLLENAVKFSAARGAIRVSARRVSPGRAEVSVTDSGSGIAPDVLPHVFEVFSQADQGLDRSKGGLGVGLAVVKGLVELHGGEVAAESAGEGRGARISLSLPLTAVREPAAADARPEETTGRRILVVEDNPDAGETLRDFLELSGHEVELACSGADGVKAARQFHPEVVLCDIGLPGMDGFEVAARLRRDPETADAQLIAVTGYGRDEDRKRSKAAGFDLHLTKPVDPTQLRHVLQQGFQRH
ncbi:MAG TPA: MEDS domain-containing protein [Thermoanaerobaculia bacterium]|nr:MEDS domain-containing protein [Thermoanaerobaculia bacterium]